MAVNDSIYQSLLRATFTVPLTRNNEIIGEITCRHLPFTTLMTILGEIAVNTKTELHEARRRILSDIISTGATNIPTDQLTDIVMPLVSSILFDTPRLTQRVLLDVCVDMTEDKIVLFSVDDVVTILQAVMERLDVARVADKARAIFTQAAAITEKVLEVQGKKDSNLAQAQKSQSLKEQPA